MHCIHNSVLKRPLKLNTRGAGNFVKHVRPARQTVNHGVCRGVAQQFAPRARLPRAARGRQQIACSLEERSSDASLAPADAQEITTALQFQSSTPGADGLLKPGDVLKGKYRIEEALGQGANATTYKATALDSGTQVAVKALALRRMRDWKALELFQREAAALRALSCPGVPQFLEYIEEDLDNDRRFFLVQELAPGRSLGDMVKAGERADEQEVLRIAGELLRILAYFGNLRPPLVHRDIKPENIVLEGGSWGGRVYLVDFGGVQGMMSDGNFASTVVGTYGYMAPEQFRGAAQPASDLYAMGATLLYLISGRPPSAFSQERMRISWRGKVTAGPLLTQLLDGLLEPLPEDRLTATEAMSVLRGEAVRGKGRGRRASEDGQGALARPTSNQVPNSYWLAPTGGQALPLSWTENMRPVRQPAGSRVTLTREGLDLRVEIPPSGLTTGTAFTGAFAVAWNAFVAFWTISALASGGLLFALFSVPFWFAGAVLGGQAIRGALMRERLDLTPEFFSLKQELALLKDGAAEFVAGGKAQATGGESRDLLGARVVTVAIVNGEPQTALELVEGVRTHRMAEGLTRQEQEWLAYELNAHLERLLGSSPDLGALPPVAAPKVVDDRTDDQIRTSQ